MRRAGRRSQTRRQAPAAATAGAKRRVLSRRDDRRQQLRAAVAEDHVPRVHQPLAFVRAVRSIPRAAGAGRSGLGLSIVKAIVERHGGTIAVTAHPGRTAFVITLPQTAVA